MEEPRKGAGAEGWNAQDVAGKEKKASGKRSGIGLLHRGSRDKYGGSQR